MLKTAARPKKLLPDLADSVERFTLQQLNPDGGFKNRAGTSDLYYTVFGLESLLALDTRFDSAATASYLEKFDSADFLDLVHLASLIRCRADLGLPIPKTLVDCLRRFAEKPRSVYDCFLILCTSQDARLQITNKQAILDCIYSLQNPDASFANNLVIKIGSTPATAAAIVTLHYLQASVSRKSTDWLLQRFVPEGGLCVAPVITTPDLLSTATALHALDTVGVCLDKIAKPCVKFVQSLRADNAGFCGSSLDKIADCEYTFYALLSLGHLANVYDQQRKSR